MGKKVLPVLVVLCFLAAGSSAEANPFSGFLNAVSHTVNNIAGAIQPKTAGNEQPATQSQPVTQSQHAKETKTLSKADKDTVWNRVMDGTYDNSKFVPSGPHEGLSPDKKKVILYIDTGFNAAPSFNQRQALAVNVRYVDNGNGTLTDTLVKGLMWAKDPNCLLHHYPKLNTDKADLTAKKDGRVFFKHAKAFVRGVDSGKYPKCGAGYRDWRLPTDQELQTITTVADSPQVVNELGQIDNGILKWLYYQGFDISPNGGTYWASNGWRLLILPWGPSEQPSFGSDYVADVWLVRGKPQ